MAVMAAGPYSCPARARSASARLVREVGLIVALFAIYNAVRWAGAQDVSTAFGSADRIWQLERYLKLPNEQSMQAMVLGVPDLVRAANGYYEFVHFPLTFLVLLWLFLRRPAHYLWARRSLVVASGVSLILYVALPVAPPRMMTALGFVDTGVVYDQSIYDNAGTSGLSNQYAAMPSLHVGWALLIAVALIAACRTAWRWLWLLHPVITFLVVVITANHYWLDGVVGLAVVSGALLVTRTRAQAKMVVHGPAEEVEVECQPAAQTFTSSSAGTGRLSSDRVSSG